VGVKESNEFGYHYNFVMVKSNMAACMTLRVCGSST